MPDTRARVAINGKAINLAQLAKEVGAALSASDVEVVVVDEKATVTAAALHRAVAAHAPAAVQPVSPLTDDEIVRLRALLR